MSATKRSRKSRKKPRIVGIGASAGGLEAFTHLLTALPEKTGLALVLVQHLNPRHRSQLSRLLAARTRRTVMDVVDGMVPEADHVYVIPANADLTLEDGHLRLASRKETAGRHLPINQFLASLAREQGERAVGVILSGAASDGTDGLGAIKARGGLTFAQDEASSTYWGMPRSAINAGLVDKVLPPDKIARELVRLGRKGPSEPLKGRTKPKPASDAELESNRFHNILKSATGVDFTHYKQSTIRRRIARRMLLLKIDTFSQYIRYLRQTQAEVDALFHDLLINVTHFFREPETFTALKEKIIPRLLLNRPNDAPIRVWVPGCASGEEVYSLGMVLMEVIGRRTVPVPIQIFGTDISLEAIRKARQGAYPEEIATHVSAARRRRFFVRRPGGYQVSKALRDLCIFARQDVTKDPPFSNLDLISCRNLLIYLGPVLQQKVLPSFQYALKPNGVLILGNSETIGGAAHLFTLIDKKAKLYAPKSTRVHKAWNRPPAHPSIVEPLLSRPTASVSTQLDFQKEADRLLLARFSPPAVVVNEALEIVLCRGRTTTYLTPSAGSSSPDLLRRIREGLVEDVKSVLAQARKGHQPVRRSRVQFRTKDGLHVLSIEVIPLKSATAAKAHHDLILFLEDTPKTEREEVADAMDPRQLPAGARLATQLHKELLTAKEFLQAAVEERERANQELQSANEEILSSNEELQSTNEELETAKEELMSINEELTSTNEELTTVNEELQSRNDESGRVNNDLANLLNSVQIPIIMLGSDLRIRRFTPMAERILNLIPGDVGRPLSDLSPNIALPGLARLIGEVTDTLVSKELEVQDAQGRWCQLRIRPYKTLENKIDGVVIALLDIEVTKRIQAEAQTARDFMGAIVETVQQPLLFLTPDLRVKSANPAFHRLFALYPDDTEGRSVFELGGGRWNVPKLRELLETICREGLWSGNAEMDIEIVGSGPKHVRLDVRRLAPPNGEPQSLLLAIEERGSG